jgi:hypothetical protein
MKIMIDIEIPDRCTVGFLKDINKFLKKFEIKYNVNLL